jgi:hypothetical protein
MTMHFGKMMCIRCSQPGHLSHQCKKPVLPLEPKKEPPLPIATEYDELADIYDEFLTGG